MATHAFSFVTTMVVRRPPPSSPSCKRCGGTNHSRASSAKCAQRVLPQKRRFAINVGAEVNVTTYTVQVGFGKFCRDRELRERIAADVFEVSALAVEASIYVHFHYTKLLHKNEDFGIFSTAFTQNHLLDFYYHLQGKRQRKERVPLDEEYFAMRKTHGLQRIYDGKLRTYLIQSIAVQHETAMKNCVCVHLFDRVVRYLCVKHERKTAKWVWKCRVYEELFSRNTQAARSLEICEMLESCGLLTDYRGFADAENNWWRLVPFSHKLATWFERNGLRSFSVFPVFRPGPKHLRYNARALHELLRSVKPSECTSDIYEFMNTTPAYWWRYFDLSGKHYGRLDSQTNVITAHRDRTKFGMSFTTNGAYCCVAMERFVSRKTDDSTDGPKSKRSKRKQTNNNNNNDLSIDSSKFSGFLGLDPGVVNYVGACYIDGSDRKRNYTLKTAKFKQSECKERVIKRRREKLIGRYERELLECRKDAEKMSVKCCSAYADALAYTVYRMQHHERSHLRYSRHKLVKLAWFGKMCTRSAEDSLVQRLLDMSKDKTTEKPSQTPNVLVCFGDGSLRDGVSYGANRKPAVCSLRRAFHRRRDRCAVVDVDEYMTTQCCSMCTGRMAMPPKHKEKSTSQKNTEGNVDITTRRRRHDHRFQFCPKCGITWNRDVNAARNIAMVARRLIDYRTLYSNNNNFVTKKITILL